VKGTGRASAPRVPRVGSACIQHAKGVVGPTLALKGSSSSAPLPVVEGSTGELWGGRRRSGRVPLPGRSFASLLVDPSTTQSVLGTTTRVCVPLRLKAGAGMTGIELARSDRSRDVRRLLRIYVVDARSISRLRRRWGSRTSLACSDPSTGSAPSSSRPIWTSSEA
jgi:hypothetical protein